MASRTVLTRVASRAGAVGPSSRALSSSSRTHVAASTSTQQTSTDTHTPAQAQSQSSQAPTEGLSRPRRDPSRNYSVNGTTPTTSAPKDGLEMRMPRTDWEDPRYHEVAPPLETTSLVPPMSQAPLRQSGHNIGVGPGANPDSSIRLAERGLHLHLRKGGHHIGPRNAFRGVPYTRNSTASEVSPTPSSSLETLHKSRKLYLESVGGDYQDYLPRTGTHDYYDWQSTLEHAFASNTSVPPQTRREFRSKVEEILEGKAEYAKRLEKPAKEGDSSKPAGKK